VGYTVAGNGTAKVSFAAPGDTNLDGLVNFSDIQAIISGGRYGQPVTTGVWNVGDFNYDGRVNFTDIQGLITAGRYGQASYFPAAPTSGLSLGGGSGLGTGSIAAVPEPRFVTAFFVLLATFPTLFAAVLVAFVNAPANDEKSPPIPEFDAGALVLDAIYLET
jgi:hypothetical protein